MGHMMRKMLLMRVLWQGRFLFGSPLAGIFFQPGPPGITVTAMNRIDVAIGIILRGERILICQRKTAGAFAGLWEFPGGKCQPGESPETCLIRELHEELAIAAQPLRALQVIEHDYPSIHVRLHPFICHCDENPHPIECQRVEWVAPQQLREYSFPEANEPLLQELLRMSNDK